MTYSPTASSTTNAPNGNFGDKSKQTEIHNYVNKVGGRGQQRKKEKSERVWLRNLNGLSHCQAALCRRGADTSSSAQAFSIISHSVCKLHILIALF